MKFNRTVFSKDGGIKLCEDDTDRHELSGLWNVVFTISVALNIFALIGNFIVVLACFFQKKRPSLIIYIRALAVSDFCYSVVAPFYTYRYVLQHWMKLTINFDLVGRLSHNLAVFANIFASISCWLIVALTIDRLILTRFPFKAADWSNPKRAHLTILLIIICCLAVHIVIFVELFEIPIIVDECSGYWKIPTFESYIPLRYNPAYQMYSVISSTAMFYILPALAMLVSNIMIIVALRKSRVAQGNASEENERAFKKRQREMRLTKMILIVSVMFLICNLPDLVTRIMWRFLQPSVVSYVQPIAHLFLMINVGGNFVIYALFNKHLFETIVIWLKKYCCLKRSCAQTA